MFNDGPAVLESPADMSAQRLPIDKAKVGEPMAVSTATWNDEALCHPFDWPESRKNRVLLTAVSATFLVGLNATAEATAGDAINAQFSINDASFPNSYWPITSWNVGAALAPPVLIPLMETFGVRYIYLACYLAFVLFLIPQAVAQNFATLIVSRFFAGVFGATIQNAAAVTSGDLWESDVNRSFAITMFNLTYLGGFTFGPVFGGAVLSGLHWRWIFYLQLIICGTHFLLVCYLLQETREHVLLKQHAKHINGDAGQLARVNSAAPPPIKELLYEAIVRSAYLLVTEPVLFIFTIWCGLAIGNVFLATQSIGQIYTANYNFTAAQNGLVQSAMFIGEVLGVAACLWQNKLFADSAKRNKLNPGVPIIEWRLLLSIPASFIGLSGGLFWYAWSSTPTVHWIMPSIGLGLIGFGTIVLVQCAVTYITDAYGSNAGSAVAALAFLENLFSGFLPLAAQRMYSRLGFQWASSTLALVALLLSFAPVVLVWKGKSSSGIFHLLPLGLRVQDKIEALVDKHMQSLGASKVSLSSITSEALWTKSGRFKPDGKDNAEIYRLGDVRGAGKTGFLLSPTHEEEITEIAAKAVRSYKQLPLRLYQISRKYRNELRPRQGLLRAREFVMKDLYTFDLDREKALTTYEEVKEAYANFFDELKIPYLTAEADSGNMGGSLSHEFHFPSEAGEDTVFSCDKCSYSANEERALSRIDDFETGLKYCRKPWIGIIAGGKDLVVAFCPTVEAQGGTARELNRHALRRAVPGIMSDIADPLRRWQTWEPLESTDSTESRRIFVIPDYRINPDEIPTDTASVMQLLEYDWDISPPQGWSGQIITTTVDPATQEPLDLCSIASGDACPTCDSGILHSQQAIELGHTFYLGTRYSEPLGAVIDVPPDHAHLGVVKGHNVPLEMGCHGIGVSRLIGATASILADRKGLNWPRAIAPYEVVVIPAAGFEEEALRLHDSLGEQGIDAIVDDRDLSMPWKLNDADLIGYPVITVISKRTWTKNKSVEVQCRRLEAYKKDHSTKTENVPNIVGSLLDSL